MSKLFRKTAGARDDRRFHRRAGVAWLAGPVLAGLSVGLLGALPHAAAQNPASRSVLEGVYTDEQTKRGQTVYESECSACHGVTLNGGESAPALVGTEFIAAWDGLTVGDLFERTRIGMPKDSPGRLSRQSTRT